MRKKHKKNFAERAYRTTRLDMAYTQGKINEMLAELNIRDVRVTQEGNDYSFEFIVRMHNDEAPRKVRINFPFTPYLGETEKQQKQRRNALFRTMLYHIKDRFVVVYNHVREFEEEFLPDLVISHNGKEVRLGDVIVPKYKEQLKNGKVAVFAIKSGE